MKKGFLVSVSAFCLLGSTTTFALDAVEQRYVDQLTQGGAASIRSAAESIYKTGMRNEEVLDVAAEVLVQRYQIAAGRSETDAVAWLCKAIGNSGNGRYTELLSQVANGDVERNIKSHCGKAAKNMPQATGKKFVAGSVNLEKYRKGNNETAKPKPQKAPANSDSKGASFSDIRVGMSMDEVNALIGQPSSTFAHQTGKAFIPFNFKGGDTVRQVALYTGKGRIVFSQENAYTSVWRVLEVTENPNETGYP
ncbi:hypothetical protein [Chrysiogenes arsenatis]|uniref:hypothetical protein n=1 Tax=Chrysiogenes arsenatis TaxID=309797 RepID=UPI0003F5E79A|nr:hypothetical protein [Chrysiogenes arsenatis]